MKTPPLPNLADPIARRWLVFVVVNAILLAAVVGFAGAVAERRATTDLARQAQASATLHQLTPFPQVLVPWRELARPFVELTGAWAVVLPLLLR